MYPLHNVHVMLRDSWKYIPKQKKQRNAKKKEYEYNNNNIIITHTLFSGPKLQPRVPRVHVIRLRTIIVKYLLTTRLVHLVSYTL